MQPFKEFGIWKVDFPDSIKRDRFFIEGEEFAEYCRNAAVHSGLNKAHGDHLGFSKEFPTQKKDQVLLKVGLSFVDV